MSLECWWCKKPDEYPMMVVRGPWAFSRETTERVFCSMKCFWDWANKMADERAEGSGELDEKHQEAPATKEPVSSD